MARTIWKFRMDVRYPAVQHPPGHFKVVHVGWEPDQGPEWITLWAEIDLPEQWIAGDPCEVAEFEVIGTGHLVNQSLAHIGSVQAGPFVWHVFEKPKDNHP
jgi:hypothetical protein